MELRCKYKVAFSNSIKALAALQKHNSKNKEFKFTGYYCCQYCKLWHLTSLPAHKWASQKKFHEDRIKNNQLGDPDKSRLGRMKKK
jgi:hypothetical protein